MSLQQIIKEGPRDGDYLGALESARWKVVDEGVKSAEDGMVWTAQAYPLHREALIVAYNSHR